MKIPHSTASKAYQASGLGPKAPSHLFLFFSSFFSFFSQQTKDRASMRIKLCDIQNLLPVENHPMLQHTENSCTISPGHLATELPQ
jgi:hypothetical protein